MIEFKDLKEEKPEYGRPVLVKFRGKDTTMEYLTSYYVVVRFFQIGNKFSPGRDIYVEADGEQYACWEEKDIAGWCYLTDLEK